MFRVKKVLNILKHSISSPILRAMPFAILAFSLAACSVKSADLSALVGAPPATTLVTTSGGGSGSSVVQFSILSGSYQTLGLYATAGLQLKVALLKGDGTPNVGQTVFFTVVGGSTNGTTSAASVVTDANGLAQVSFTSAGVAGAISITASTSGQTSLTFSESVSNVSNYAIAKTLTSNGNSQSGAVGSTLSNPFKVVVTDAGTGFVVPNVVVRFFGSQGAVAGNFSGANFVDVTTDVNGIATSTNMTFNTVGGVTTIRAYLVGNSAIFTDFTSTGTVPSGSTVDPAQTTVAFSSTTANADNSTTITATVLVKDQYGNLIPNSGQTISTTTTPATSANNIGTLASWNSGTWTYASAGTYTRSFTVNTIAGTVTIGSLTVSGVSVTSTLASCVISANATVVLANSIITSSAPSITADGVSTATITVTLEDLYHNQISASGHTVVASANIGTLGSTTLAYHSPSGTYRTTFVAPSTLGSGSATITLASIDGTPVTGVSTSITLLQAAINNLAFTAQPVNNYVAGADTALGTPFTVTEYDGNGNVDTSDSLSSVTLTAYSAANCTGSVVTGGVIAASNPLIVTNGVAAFSSVYLTKVAVVSVQASTGSKTACSNSFGVAAGNPAALAFTSNPGGGTYTAGVPFGTQPAVQIVDDRGNSVNTVNSGTATLTISSGSIVAGATSGTFSSGLATFTGVQSNTAGTNLTVTATASGKVGTSTSFTIQAGAFNAANSLFSAYPRTIATSAGSSTTTISFSAFDTWNNPVSGQSVSLSSNRGATDTITTSPATTNSSGVATFSVYSATPGYATLTTTAGLATSSSQILFLSATPQLDYEGAFATGLGAGSNTTPTSSWKNLVQAASTNDATLSNFAYSLTGTPSGWGGSGTTSTLSLASGPNRLYFDGATNFLNMGTSMTSATNATIDTWIYPSNVPTSIGNTNQVILGNGDTSGYGMSLRTTSAEPGKLTLSLGSNRTYAEEVLTDSPVGYWRLGETSGTTAINLGSCGGNSANCNGTYGSGSTLAQYNSALNDSDYSINTNGAATAFTLPDNTTTNMAGATALTIEAWFKAPVGTQQNAILAKDQTSGNYYGYLLCAGNCGYGAGAQNSATQKLSFSLIAASGNYSFVTTNNFLDGNWHHLVAIYDATTNPTIRMYVDGSLQAGSTNSGTPTLPTSLSSSTGYIPYSGFNGSLDEVAIYSTTLDSHGTSTARILAHYNARTRTTCNSKTVLTNSTWYHVTGLWNSLGGDLNLYVNGTQECTALNASGFYTNSANNLSAGDSLTVATANVGSYWQGAIASVRAFTSALTNSMINGIYSVTSANFDSWSPTGISGLTLWYSASDITTLYKTSDCSTTQVSANNDVVACWKDKSGNANNATQSSGTYQPIYATNSINSMPGVSFGTGASYSYLQSGSLTMYNRTLFVVSRVRGTAKGSYNVLIDQTASPYYMIYTGWQLLYNATAISISPASGNQLHTGIFANSYMSYRINGSTIGNTAVTTASLTNSFQIGALSGQSSGLNGDIDEVLVYNTVLTETQIKRVEAYLNAKYNLY